MKKLIKKLLIACVLVFSLQSCVVSGYAQDSMYDDDVAISTEVSNTDVSLIVRFGTPYYYNNRILYYLYNGIYYYPFYYDNYWYFRPYRYPIRNHRYIRYFRPQTYDMRFRHGRTWHHRPADRPRYHIDRGHNNRPRPNFGGRPDRRPDIRPNARPGHNNHHRR